MITVQDEPGIIALRRGPPSAQNCSVSIIEVDTTCRISEGKAIASDIYKNRRPTVAAGAGADNTSLLIATSTCFAHALVQLLRVWLTLHTDEVPFATIPGAAFQTRGTAMRILCTIFQWAENISFYVLHQVGTLNIAIVCKFLSAIEY